MLTSDEGAAYLGECALVPYDSPIRNSGILFYNTLFDENAACRDNTHQGRPQVILAHTEMGMGVDFMMGTHKWHGSAPNDEQAAKALSQLTETLGDY